MKYYLRFICIIFVCFSCENEGIFGNLNNQPQDNFYGLAVGNYWVYKSKSYNIIEDKYIDNGVIDSVSIIATEIIDGETYFKFRTKTTGNDDTWNIFNNPNGEKFEYFRELDGDLINEEGVVKFTNNNYEERLVAVHNWGNIYETLVEGSTIINVDAGEFECINSERYAKNPDGDQLLGLDRFYYADGFGLIYDTISFINLSRPSVVRCLVTYKIQ